MVYSEISTVVNSQLAVSNFLTYESREEIIAGIYAGLTARQKWISSRFFYDDIGSALFEDITHLPEYYPTRTEKAIIRQVAHQIMRTSKNINIIELGSGDCSKISILLDAVSRCDLPKINYYPVDVSEAAIMKSADLLSLRYPKLKMHGLLADFMKHLTELPGDGNRLICFFGSTLGNLTRKQSLEFLSNMNSLMAPGDRFLLGLDMVKDVQMLESAYNDKQGVTAAFNKNILRVINDTANTNFDPDMFAHVSFYNPVKSRIEMHLRALCDMIVTSPEFPQSIFIRKDETIHTENSHKYTIQDIMEFACLTGWKVGNIFTDYNRLFSVVEYRAREKEGFSS